MLFLQFRVSELFKEFCDIIIIDIIDNDFDDKYNYPKECTLYIINTQYTIINDRYRTELL